MRWPGWAVTLGVLTLAMSACGGGSADTDALVAAIADQVESAAATGETPFERADAECIARAYVESLGVATMAERGLDVDAVVAGSGPGDLLLSEPEVNDIAAAMGDCLDMAEIMSGSLGYAELSEDSLSCLTEEFEGGIETALMRNTIRYGELLPAEDPTVGLEIFGAFGSCVTPQELERIRAGE